MSAETLINHGCLIGEDANVGVGSGLPETDDTPDWVRAELEERMRRLDSGEEKVLTLQEAWEQLEAFKRDVRNRKP